MFTSRKSKILIMLVIPSFKFKLPAELKNIETLQICLKDRTTSYLQCANVRNK